MEKVKVGVFGARRGMTMIELMSRYPDAQLVAVCDKYEPHLKKCRELADGRGISISLYTDFEKFIQEDMDAVILANYANEHAPYAIRLLESGRHVMSEVLPAQTLDEALRLCEAVEKSGRVYNYAENYCFFNSTFEMRRRYEKGDIGEVTHAEGSYIHDCSSIWPQITYGERNHWRNRMFSTFYCTHSIGPMLYITGRRPVRITGMDNQPVDYMMKLGCTASVSGIALMQLDNGATAKSINGHLRRKPEGITYEIFGTKGCMETDRWDYSGLYVYTEAPDANCCGKLEKYTPEAFNTSSLASGTGGHGGSDFYTSYFFIRSILGDEEAKKYAIDVYRALDMGVPGLLAYKSILNGNKPMEMIDFRDKAVREQCRGDNSCTDPVKAGEMLMPISKDGDKYLPDSVYDAVREKWEKGLPG